MKLLPAGSKLLCIEGHTIGYTTRDLYSDDNAEQVVTRSMFYFTPDNNIGRAEGDGPHKCPTCGKYWTGSEEGGYLGRICTEHGWWPTP